MTELVELVHGRPDPDAMVGRAHNYADGLLSPSEMEQAKEDYVEGGLTLNEFEIVVRILLNNGY